MMGGPSRPRPAARRAGRHFLCLVWLQALFLSVHAVAASGMRVSFAPSEPSRCMVQGLPALAQGTSRMLRVEGPW
ncbi:MAG: hypothetical protein D6775_04165, partial [Caldilineae bacterium]